jgi:hypothetical protein
MSHSFALGASTQLEALRPLLARIFALDPAEIAALDDPNPRKAALYVELQPTPGAFPATLDLYPAAHLAPVDALQLGAALSAAIGADVLTEAPACWEGTGALHWALIHPSGRAHRVYEAPTDALSIDPRPARWEQPPAFAAPSPLVQALDAAFLEGQPQLDPALINQATPGEQQHLLDLLLDRAQGHGEPLATATLTAWAIAQGR